MERSTRVWRLSRAVAAGVALFLLEAGVAAAGERPGPSRGAWGEPLAAAERAVDQGDLRGAGLALHTAYGAALASRTWEAMAEVGDAYRRVAETSTVRWRPQARAREAYLTALFRARQQGSLAGVSWTAEGFAALGDREVVNACIQIAKGLVARLPNPHEREGAYASVERLARRLLALDSRPLD